MMQQGIVVSIHTLHELEASFAGYMMIAAPFGLMFPFIRFTNWKQVGVFFFFGSSVAAQRFHSYASRIGSKLYMQAAQMMLDEEVSIHTLHELEASTEQVMQSADAKNTFPFIRFTNWKQEHRIQTISVWLLVCFHSYASRIGSKLDERRKTALLKLLSIVSIHTLHELEARELQAATRSLLS
jgi:hypothetical protein